MAWTPYDMIAPLIGVGGGALAGLLSARAAVRGWERSRQDSAAKLTVDLIKDLATEVARAAHNICWLTWKARYDASGFSKADADRYDEEMHQSIPKLLGAQTALAAIDSVSAAKLNAAVKCIMELDGRVGGACIRAKAGDVAPLAEQYDAALAAEAELFDTIRDVAANVLGNRANVKIR